MQKPKIERLESDIKKALMQIIRTEVKHPAIQFVTITDVDLTNDLSYLTVLFTTLDDEEEKRDNTKKALEQSQSFLRTELGKRVTIRKMPVLRFRYDDTLEKANRIERGLKAVRENETNNDDKK